MNRAARRKRNVSLGFRALAAREPSFAGVSPQTVKGILQSAADAPLRGGDRDLGEQSLFGIGVRQKSLF